MIFANNLYKIQKPEPDPGVFDLSQFSIKIKIFNKQLFYNFPDNRIEMAG